MTAYYAAPTVQGSGTGDSPANAFRPASFWSVATAGDILFLTGTDPTTDGYYSAAASVNNMLNPPSTVHGGPGSYITIKALVDGGVLIDGSTANQTPIRTTTGVDYLWFEGFDCKGNRGTNTEACIYARSNNCVYYRLIAYDIAVGNNNSVIMAYGLGGSNPAAGINNLFEDCAAFGTGRKMFETFSNPGPNTFRRCWSRWEASTTTGPKRDYQSNYHSYNTTFENCISRWSGKMPNPYTVTDPVGAPLTTFTPTGGACQGTGTVQSDGSCLMPANNLGTTAEGTFGESVYAPGQGDSNDSGTKIYGCLFVQTTADVYSSSICFYPATMGNFTVKDMFIYMAPGVVRNDTGIAPQCLRLINGDGTRPQSTITNATTISITTDLIQSKWTASNVLHGNDLSVLGTGSLYDGASGGTPGAAIKYRYQDGVLTSNLLWPWPMSSRILAATTRASTDGHGHNPENVDSYVQSVFGSFPPTTPNGVWFTS